LRRRGSGERFYVIVFQEATPTPRIGKQTKVKATPGGSRENAHLKRELAQTREQFQTLLEEHETVSEEFKSANEEVLSANEELQSTNEELETAKEELQSSNEELTTLNEELQSRNSELTAVNNDLLNVLGNVTIPVVIVGQDLHIRRFTTPAQKLLNLLPSDVGRRLSDIRPNLDVEDLGQIASESIENVAAVEREVREAGTGTWHLMRVRPYKTWDSKIDGAVISFQDIDAMKRSFDQMHLHADALSETAREAILILNGKLQVISANLAFYRNFEVSREETQNRPIYDLGNRQWNIPRLRELLESILPNNGRVEGLRSATRLPPPRIAAHDAQRPPHRTSIGAEADSAVYRGCDGERILLRSGRPAPCHLCKGRAHETPTLLSNGLAEHSLPSETRTVLGAHSGSGK
jgi:two-component system, chemotaxis family, CheB/CheR fusion protein